jgi:hypothetical protein
MVDEPGVRFGLASGAIVLALLIAGALPLDRAETAGVALLAAAFASASLPWLLVVGLSVEAWAFFTGFFENRYGTLTLAPHDLMTLVGFVGATVVLTHVLRARPTAAPGGQTR